MKLKTKDLKRDGEVFIFISDTGDMEVLDGMPKWDWNSQFIGEDFNEQRGRVFVANINGGDSLLIPMPRGNKDPEGRN